jgi:hypothetical protein
MRTARKARIPLAPMIWVIWGNFALQILEWSLIAVIETSMLPFPVEGLRHVLDLVALEFSESRLFGTKTAVQARLDQVSHAFR